MGHLHFYNPCGNVHHCEELAMWQSICKAKYPIQKDVQ